RGRPPRSPPAPAGARRARSGPTWRPPSGARGVRAPGGPVPGRARRAACPPTARAPAPSRPSGPRSRSAESEACGTRKWGSPREAASGGSRHRAPYAVPPIGAETLAPRRPSLKGLRRKDTPGRHGRAIPARPRSEPYSFFDSTILPPFFSHSALDDSIHPLPLQAFWPWQEFAALAHAAWPLHALMPAQWTVSAPAFSPARATTAPLRNRPAAALAIKIPLLDRFMHTSLVLVGPRRSSTGPRPL